MSIELLKETISAVIEKMRGINPKLNKPFFSPKQWIIGFGLRHISPYWIKSCYHGDKDNGQPFLVGFEHRPFFQDENNIFLKQYT